MTTTNTESLTTVQAAQLNAGRISGREIYYGLCCQDRCFIEIENMLTVAATANYLDCLDKDNLPAPEDAAHGLFQKTVDTFREFNEKLDENEEPLDMPEELTPYQVAKLMMALCHIRLVVDRDRYEYSWVKYESDEFLDRYAVMLYVADKSGIYDGGSDIGTYTGNFWPLIETLSSRSIEDTYLAFSRFADEVEFWLRIFAPKAGLSCFQGVMPLKNGVLNCRTKEFLPFSPEYVFIENTYGGFYEEGEDGPIIRYDDGTEESVDDWIKDAALYDFCEELRRVLAECV